MIDRKTLILISERLPGDNPLEIKNAERPMHPSSDMKSPGDLLSPDTIRTEVLEAIDYKYRLERDIDIVIEQPEFTSVCPMTGLPDFGTIVISYRPDQVIIELKSLKYYLLQYRNVGIFYEHVVNHILNDLTAVSTPKRMTVTGKFSARGGITTNVTAVYEGKK